MGRVQIYIGGRESRRQRAEYIIGVLLNNMVAGVN